MGMKGGLQECKRKGRECGDRKEQQRRIRSKYIEFKCGSVTEISG